MFAHNGATSEGISPMVTFMGHYKTWSNTHGWEILIKRDKLVTNCKRLINLLIGMCLA